MTSQQPFKLIERMASRSVLFDENEHSLVAPEASIPDDETLLSQISGPFTQNRHLTTYQKALDLYGPTFYPDGKATAGERIAWGTEYFQREVGLDKFRLFFAVQEFEAWLLSQPEIFAHEIRRVLPDKVARPETVNFNEPPAKLLDRIYKQVTRRSYKKTTTVNSCSQSLPRQSPSTNVRTLNQWSMKCSPWRKLRGFDPLA